LFVLLRRPFRRRHGVAAIKAALTALLGVALTVLMGTAPAAAAGGGDLDQVEVYNVEWDYIVADEVIVERGCGDGNR